MDIDYFLKINNAYGTVNKKDKHLYDIKKHVNNRFADTIDFYTILKDGQNQDLLIIRTKDENVKTIKARPDEDFDVGDCVFWENNYWLIITKDLGNQVYTSGKMQLCNYTLTFQHKKTGAILSYPCIKQSSNISTGIDEGKVISVGNALHTIKLPFDSVTKLIDVDDRFFIDDLTVEKPQVYAVSKPDRTTYRYGSKGIIELTMISDQYNDTVDRIDLGVCDYFEPEAPVVDDDGEYVVIKCSNTKNELSVGGSFRTITATFYDNYNNIIETINPIWSIDYKGIDSKYFVVEYIEKQLKIKVLDNYDLIGSVISIHVTNNPNNYQGNLDLLIVY